MSVYAPPYLMQLSCLVQQHTNACHTTRANVSGQPLPTNVFIAGLIAAELLGHSLCVSISAVHPSGCMRFNSCKINGCSSSWVSPWWKGGQRLPASAVGELDEAGLALLYTCSWSSTDKLSATQWLSLEGNIDTRIHVWLVIRLQITTYAYTIRAICEDKLLAELLSAKKTTDCWQFSLHTSIFQ